MAPRKGMLAAGAVALALAATGAEAGRPFPGLQVADQPVADQPTAEDGWTMVRGSAPR